MLVGLFVLVTVASVVGNWATTPPDRLAPVSGSSVQVQDNEVHYQHWGQGGTPLVLLPGFAESSEAFSLAGPLLAQKGYSVYAMDLSGYGYTRGGDVHDLRDQVEMASGFIQALHLDRPVVAGHSMGASVAGGLGLWHPGQTRGVVFVDGDAQDLQFGSPRLRSLLMGSPYATSLYRIFTRWTWLDRKALASSCGSACTAFDGQDGARRAQERMRPLTQGEVERTLLGGSGAHGILHLTEQQMRDIRVPRGIVWGREDKRAGGSLAQTQERLGSPRTAQVRGAGHDVMMGNPKGFAAAVDRVAQGF